MPSYEFQCQKKKCGHAFEQICSFKDYDAGFPDVKCPKCRGKKVKKLLNFSVHALNSTDKMNNFEYAAEKNMEKAQIQSHNAREEAKKKGITSPYADLPDFTDNGRRMNFID